MTPRLLRFLRCFFGIALQTPWRKQTLVASGCSSGGAPSKTIAMAIERKKAAAAKTYKETAGMPPGPVKQSPDAEPLLAADAEPSDAPDLSSGPPANNAGAAPGTEPAEAATGSLVQANATPRRAITTEAGYALPGGTRNEEVSEVRVDTYALCCGSVRPVCCTMITLVGLTLAYATGYVHREHQAELSALHITELEERLGIYAAIEGVRSLDRSVVNPHNVSEWLHGPADAESCADGLAIPGPVQSPGSTLTFLGLLLWSFVGVAIGADLFMEAIEQITSQEVTRTVTMPSGKTRRVTAHVWNATVANLTLMALGSSAPEILLSVSK